MSDRDRVHELETTVSELQSTVKGLTEELVETKDRLRAVEQELGIDTTEFTDVDNEPSEQSTRDTSASEADAASSADTADDTETSDPKKQFDDIIVA